METKVNLKEIINNRILKLKEIKDNGVNPFPHNFNATHEISEVLENKEDLFDENISLVGRIISQRKMGKACFLNLVNEHSKIQLYIKNVNLQGDTYDLIVRKLDIGDFIGVEGKLFYTKTIGTNTAFCIENCRISKKSRFTRRCFSGCQWFA